MYVCVCACFTRDAFTSRPLCTNQSPLYYPPHLHCPYYCITIAPPPLPWPLHDIVITNSVWCIAYKWEVGRGVVYCPIIVQNSIAPGWAIQVGAENEG